MPSTRTRNLVVLLDGTWNDPEQEEDGLAAPTNVVKLDRALGGGKSQVAYYEEGVGTRAWEALPGGLYGFGLEKRILGGYRFLQGEFANRDWERSANRVFLFGFSRGAYTARRLSGLLAHSGIPKRSRDVNLGWELYRERDLASIATLKREGRFFDVPIEMIGVWDTVKATNDEDYHDNVLGANVTAGYHAIAIDECRRFFPVLRWKKERRVKEVWFTGVHCDVGGGYASAGLSDVALSWMLRCAIPHGLRFKKSWVQNNVAPSSKGEKHTSLKGIWVPLGKKLRTIRKADLVHPSVEKRLAADSDYRPPNLPAEPNFGR